MDDDREPTDDERVILAYVADYLDVMSRTTGLAPEELFDLTIVGKAVTIDVTANDDDTESVEFSFAPNEEDPAGASFTLNYRPAVRS